jgi:SAM-dependent methyltransferase
VWQLPGLANSTLIRRQSCVVSLAPVTQRNTGTLEHSEKLGRAFDPSGGYWRDYYASDAHGAEPIGAERLQVFGEALAAVPAKGLWLEAGCGIGVMAREFRRAGLRVCGIDVSAKLLEEAQMVSALPIVPSGETASAEEHLCRASVDQTPYPDGHFDGVYSSSVLEYAADLELALVELRRVVKKDGHIVFNLPNAFSLFRMAHALRRRKHPYYELVPRWAYWKWEILRKLERSGWGTLSLMFYGAERNAPTPPLFVPRGLRLTIASQPWAASFVLISARAA